MEPNQRDKTSKHNRTRDIERKNKLTVTGGGGGSNRGKKGKGRQGTCIKDLWTRTKGDRIEGRRWGGWGGGKWW